MATRSPLECLRHAELLNAALAYAALGWKVFPIRCPVFTESGVRCSCGKKSCNKPGRHPHISQYPKAATTNDNVIDGWWKEWPDANVGILTGRDSGIFVLDVDPRNDGDESLERLERKHGRLPKTVTAISGGGGRHYYFPHPGGQVKSHDGAFGPDYPGLDIKADGGCIFAPPSLHETGNKYEWVEGLKPQHTKLAPLPGWILKQIRNKKTKRTKGRKGQADQLSQTPIFSEGRRNNSMMKAAGSLNQFCHSQTEIFQHLVLFNQDRCDPPLSESEVRSVANSAHKYQTDSPAELLFALWTPLVPLEAKEKSVLTTLIKMCDWATWRCFPSHKTIGDYAGMGTSSVQRALGGLKEKGFVSWTQTGHRSNDYQLHTEKIFQCQTESKTSPSESTPSLYPPPLDSKSYRPTDRGCGQAEERVEGLCDSPSESRSDPHPPDT